MDITISDEQIKKIAEEQVKNILKPRIDKVLSRWSNQMFEERIQRSIHTIVEERFSELVPDERLMKLVKKSEVSKHIADSIVKVVSKEIVDTITDNAY